jgi:hypothetical protein
MDKWLFVGAIVVVAAGLVAFALSRVYSKEAVVQRGLWKMSATPIKDVVSGARVKIKGRLGYQGEPIAAPLTGRKCAYYSLRVDVAGPNKTWLPVVKEEKGSDFVLDDGTGKAIVHYHADKVVATHDAGMHSRAPEGKKIDLAGFLASRGQESFEGKELRCFEGVLEEGEIVAAAGVGKWDGKTLVLSAPDGDTMLITDAPASPGPVNTTIQRS